MRICILLLFLGYTLQAQTPIDSLKKRILPEITVVGQETQSDVAFIPDIVGTQIYAGKKSALLILDNTHANTLTNTMRQVAAKVPGIQVWESDGSGLQIGIAARGLSPNRSWEFNVRQNGYDIAADPFGYPEAYYNPQLQAVQRIEIVRGQAALQYGPQFGGLVNYILKDGSQMRKTFQLQSTQSVGSAGLFNSYNAIGGRFKQGHYYAFYDRRQAEGFRQNSAYHSNTAAVNLNFQPTKNWFIGAEFTHYNMLSQQAGGLTDAQFQQDIQQSFRSRNWFKLDWNVAALKSRLEINAATRLETRIFGVFAHRNSVGFMPSGGISVLDVANVFGIFPERKIDKDAYINGGAELKLLKEYEWGGKIQNLSAGLRLYRGRTNRLISANGSRGADANMEVSEGGKWHTDIDFNSQDVAFFVEHLFQITPKTKLIPGFRYEYLKGGAAGTRNNSALAAQSLGRGFFLAGLGLDHQIKGQKLYANITQAYRPVQFADLITPPTTDVLDPNLKDANGFNADLGLKGMIGSNFIFDFGGYYLGYNNRIGTIYQQNQQGSFYNFRTNVGASYATGIEAFGEWTFLRKGENVFDIFATYAFNEAKYRRLTVVQLSNGQLVSSDLKNNRVENAPKHILRAGLQGKVSKADFTVQYSYVSDSFSDANNTLLPTANAQNGLIPSYQVWDATLGYHFGKFDLKGGVNNFLNARYFTRRATGYPGPGILPAEGRNWFLSANVKI